MKCQLPGLCSSLRRSSSCKLTIIDNRTSIIGQGGQTLIALMIFMLLAIMITTASVAVAVINLQGGSAAVNGETALGNATTGAENALLQLERNPSYSGETMTLANGTATITVSGTASKTIVSVGSFGNFARTVTVTATVSNNAVTETNWTEAP